MGNNKDLRFFEELLLLALRDKVGTISANETTFLYALAGSLLAELLLLEKVSVQPVKKKKMVNLLDSSRLGDPILDECLEKLRAAKRRATLNTWVSRFAGIKKLKHRAAQQLCRRGILRADEKSVLLIFSKKVYPELDPGPERELVDRLRSAIFSDTEELDQRTVVLVALADRAGVLKNVFDKRELKAKKRRIESIGEGEVTAAAVKEVVDAMSAAIAASAAAGAAVSAAT
jgi:hypothetical protein